MSGLWTGVAQLDRRELLLTDRSHCSGEQKLALRVTKTKAILPPYGHCRRTGSRTGFGGVRAGHADSDFLVGLSLHDSSCRR